MKTPPKRSASTRRRIKRDIYMISSFLTALAGTFYTQYIYFIDPATAFSFNISIEAALVSIVGGIGTLWGPVIGTVLLETTSTLLQSWLGSSIGGVQLTVYSLILMAVILWRPTGLMGMIARSLAAPCQPQAGAGVRASDGRSARHSRPQQAVRRPARRAGRQLHREGKRDRRADRARTAPARPRASISSPAFTGPTPVRSRPSAARSSA